MLVGANMRGLWNDRFLLGIEEIDKQHKTLAEILEKFGQIVADGNHQAAKDFLLTKIKEYIEFHFSYEEAFQESIGYPELEQHRKTHQVFVKEYEKVLELLDKEDKSAIDELNNFLIGWLFTHIDKTDRKYAEFYFEKNKSKEQKFYKVDVAKSLWNDRFLLGIEEIEIDNQHEGFARMLEEFLHMVAQENYEKTKEHLLTKVKEYIDLHFPYEEAFMESIGYPELEQHKKAHKLFINEYNKVLQLLKEEDSKERIRELSSFLIGWLFTHIDKTDKKFAKFYHEKNKAP